MLAKQSQAAAEGLPWPGPTASDAGDAVPSGPVCEAVTLLLRLAPSERLGARAGAEDLRAHAAFSGLDWAALASATARGPPADASVGPTLAQALDAPRRPRRGPGPCLVPPASEGPDPFEGF